MAGKEIRIYGEDESAIKIRPYEHHAKYYETDQMGIIHHSNYIKWMEEARMDLMEQIGLSYKQMEEMDLLDQVAAVGMKKKNCEVSDIADKMSKKKDEKQAEVIYGGKERDPKYRDLVKQEVNLALVSSDLLPAEDKTTKKGKTITEEDQLEQWEKITEKYALLGIPMIVDRSADEKDDLAKAEWIKVYGVIFGCEEQAEDLYNKAVQQAGEK